MVVACNVDRTSGPEATTPESLASAAARGTPGPGGGGGGGGGDEGGYGNNLSVPVIFAEARGISGASVLNGADRDFTGTGFGPNASVDDAALTELSTGNSTPFFFSGNTAEPYLTTDVFWQKSANVWQADWEARTGRTTPAIVDWGDNLQSVTYSATSVIRVEHTLYADDGSLMQGFTHDITINPSSANELQGIYDDGAASVTTMMTPTVFSDRARLRIEKLDGPSGNPVYAMIDRATYESFGIDGPGGYGAELNVGGKLIYGYVWNMKKVVMPPGVSKEGWWRITFSLDAGSGVSLSGLHASDTTLANLTSTATSAEIEIKSRRGGGKQ